MIPKRYLFASMFIAAMLMLLAVVQAPRSTREGGAVLDTLPVEQTLESFETLAEYRLQDGWAPRYQGAQDPDQEQPWPFGGGFGTPWEPASAYLADQGLALNGPGGHSEVILWRGLEWRHYKFDAPIASARLDPARATRLLVTLVVGKDRFETRLMEVPEGRVLWATDSGPWSRFSWDGRAVLLGLRAPQPENALLLTALPVDGDLPPPTLAAWDEREPRELPAVPRGWATRQEHLWDDGQDLPGARLLVPWQPGARLWFPRQDRLWVTSGGQWTLWALKDNAWRRIAGGPGTLAAQPPLRMGLLIPERKGEPARRMVTGLAEAEWKPVPATEPAWPEYDPAWAWGREDLALTAWDQRWGTGAASLPPERQRQSLLRTFRPEWRTAQGLRASVKGWIPEGPESALRETAEAAWVWVGDRVILVRLQQNAHVRAVKSALKR